MGSGAIGSLVGKFNHDPDRLQKARRLVVSYLLKWFARRNRNNYPNYPIDYTSLGLNIVIAFVKRNVTDSTGLVVVHPAHIDHVQRLTNATVVDCSGLDALDSLEPYNALYWATDRSDTNARAARYFMQNHKTFLPITQVGPARCWHHDPSKERVMLEEYALQTNEGFANFGYGAGADFGNLLQAIDQTAHLDGDYVEIGCLFGSSSCVMVRYMEQKTIRKRFCFYDVFDGFNYPEALASSDTTWKGSHITDGLDAVKFRILSRTTTPEMIGVFKRNICESDSLKEVQAIAFANIDVDMYEAVLAALHEVHRKIVVGGIIVVEDAGHTPRLIGALGALYEFLEDVGKSSYLKLQFESGQYFLVRK